MSSNDLEREWLWGGAAARAFGTKDPRSVWRAVERYGAEFPGRIEVVTFGRGKMARREELEAFTAWFLAGPGRSAENIRRARSAETAEPEREPEAAAVAMPATTALSVAPVAGRTRAAVTDARRAKLRRRIAQLMEME